ncbi:MAG: hypothetical protein IMZ55_15470 [Acidobacteria bacterium]|nr:hypothetical protein [Acidobacteriota bacterium]
MPDLQTKYLEVLARYRDLPQAPQADSDLDDELAHYEHEMLLATPPGKARGLTMTNFAPQPTLVAPEEVGIIDLPEKDWPDAIAQAKAARARPFDHFWHQLDQDGKGSCAGEGCTGLLMGVREHMNQKRVVLNPWSLYYFSGGGRDAGSSLQDNIHYAQKLGVCPESVWGRDKGLRKPSDEAMAAALSYRILEWARIETQGQIIFCLTTGRGVFTGYTGHAFFLDEAIDPLRYGWRNSWGNWGDNGRGTISHRSLQLSYGLWVPQSVVWEGP